MSAAPTERAHDHERNTELLDAELPERRYRDSRYLHWLYDQNPLGRAFTASADEEGRRMAHYAVVPQEYRDRSGPQRFVFSLHAVTRSGAQRKGYFSALGEQIYEEARQWGALGVIGVSNDNSTPPVVKRLGFRLLGPLPVRVVVPLRRGVEERVEHLPVTDELLAGPRFAELAAELATAVDELPSAGWINTWRPDVLRWRLAAPNCGPFVLHVTPDVVAVSTASHLGPVPAAVLLKLVARRRPWARIDGGPAAAAVCRHHRAPFLVYAGFNRHVRVRGIRPPRRLQPSPLNLIYRSLDERAPNEGFRLDTFEFLDMDVY